ncbi:MAG: hypothetical protein EBS41_06685 [Actinobacteria bacterium]|nr:hypothetical protein [Actinomycetota bacterium]
MVLLIWMLVQVVVVGLTLDSLLIQNTLLNFVINMEVTVLLIQKILIIILYFPLLLVKQNLQFLIKQ